MNSNEYILFAIENRCNSKCNFCSIGGGDGALTDLTPVSMSFFKKFLKIISKDKYPGIIFSGGEPTLNKELPQYASYAREKGFRHIMIQTNGIALSDIHLAEKLKASGVNQFFVSFQSVDRDISHQMSGRIGAYVQTLKALENLAQLDLTVITNTVMTSMNYKELPPIARFLMKFHNISEMTLGGYEPMSSKASELVLPYALAAPYLNQAIEHVLSNGRNVCVKFFPVCLLDSSYQKYHKKDLPYSLGVKKSFYERGGLCGFKHCPSCERTDCFGLPEIYEKMMPPGSWRPSVKD